MVLKRVSDNSILLSQLSEARTTGERAKGLLGRESLSSGEGLWIHRCNSIHTFFMRFSIDCIFLNPCLEVVSLKEDVKPWGLVWPQWGAVSVIEISAGGIRQMGLKTGDLLHVGT